MKWSYGLLRVAGIEVRVHATFIFLLLWIAIVRWRSTGSMDAVIDAIGFILLLFGCVVLHEFGHALTARRFGVRTRDIVLLPIGGVAQLESMPKKPYQEMLVALAGPAVNLVIALILWPLVFSTTDSMDLTTPLNIEADPADFDTLNQLMRINLMLALFNLLPAFPMDGGRVLRAGLSMIMPAIRATRMAAALGQGLAVVLGFLGLMGNPWLLFIAVFVWIGAASEARYAEMKSAITEAPITRAMLSDFQTLDEYAALGNAVDLTLAGSQKDFPVMRGSKVIGVLTSEALLAGLRESGEIGVVKQYMTSALAEADINENLEDVLGRFQSGNFRIIAVYDSGSLAGIVNLDNLLEWIQMSNAITQSRE